MAAPMSSWRNRDAPVALDQEAVLEALGHARAQLAVEDAAGRGALAGRLTERGAGRSVTASKASATAARRTRSSARPAGARWRRTRRHSRERTASRPATISSSEPLSDTVGNSRRAASSSSATSGLPPERSATRSSRLAEGRSPSMPSMSAASSSRRRPGQDLAFDRTGCRRQLGHGRGPRGVPGDDVGLVGQDDGQPLVGRDAGQEGGQVARRRVGSMEVLEDEQDRRALPQPTERGQHALHDPDGASLGRDRLGHGHDAQVETRRRSRA